MSDQAREFVEQWIESNVHATGYEPDGDNAEAKKLAFACWADADKMAISRATIESEFGSLVDHMTEALEAVNDAEVERLIAKDPD